VMVHWVSGMRYQSSIQHASTNGAGYTKQLVDAA
jgi:hypothetical protein